MPEWLTTHRARPWHHAGHRILRPFADPEAREIRGDHPDYCLTCKEYGTGEKQGAFEGSVYAFRVTCRRCGGVIRYAVFNQSGDAATGQRARQWDHARKDCASCLSLEAA